MRAVLDNFESCLRQRRQREVRAWSQLICYVLTVLRELPEDDVCWLDFMSSGQGVRCSC